MKIKKTINTPEIIFNKESCELTFRGASYPINAMIFYEPIKKELKKYLDELVGLDKEIIIICEFTLLNSTSTRYIYDFFKYANSFSKHNKPINVKWFYEKDDEGMELEGNIFKGSLKKLNFEVIGVDDLDNI
jgi:hypothetical protein